MMMLRGVAKRATAVARFTMTRPKSTNAQAAAAVARKAAAAVLDVAQDVALKVGAERLVVAQKTELEN